VKILLLCVQVCVCLCGCGGVNIYMHYFLKCLSAYVVPFSFFLFEKKKNQKAKRKTGGGSG